MNSSYSTWLKPFLIVAIFSLLLMSCKDDDKPKLIPEVTTASVTDITPNTAVGGGEVINNGNDAISKLGLCWSNSNSVPTTSDSKNEVAISEGSFISKLEGLASGTTIYVRAYASNSIGTGYGEVISFMTGNAAPVVSGLSISGTAEVNKQLIASYTYSDAEGNAESGTTIQWYRAQDGSGTSEVAIAGATTNKYTLQDVDEFRFVRCGVMPKSSTGNQMGVEVKSSYLGPIAIRTTLSFIYNGSEVTYGIITSTVTGRKWLDRNLGAPNTPLSQDDYANFGDLFQWGRGADGHQLLIRNPTTRTFTPTNGITTNLSSMDNPGHSLYINTGTALPRDWRSPQNSNLWQEPLYVNNPCPMDWHVPTEAEWDAEMLTSLESAFSRFKITKADGRLFNGEPGNSYYWSSSSAVLSNGVTIGAMGYAFELGATTNTKIKNLRGGAYNCRCIKN